MPISSRKSAETIVIHRDSILLPFTDQDAAIARDWQPVKKHDVAKENRDV